MGQPHFVEPIDQLFRMCKVGILQRTESLGPDRLQDALYAMVRLSDVIIRSDDIDTPDMM